MHAKALKLIALLLPPSVADRVRQEQQYIALHFGPKHALRTPPHITLIPPLAVTPAENSLLIKMAEKISHAYKPFSLQLDGFDAFPPKVVYLRLQESPALEALYKLWRRELMLQLPHLLDKYPDRPYHPHVTLAHRDVTREQFNAIREHFSGREFRTAWEVKGFWTLEHVPRGWEPEREFGFLY